MLKTATPALLVAACVSLAGCHAERRAKADTGTAEATVKTRAPESAVSSSDLQQQAQAAATAASTPVAGSKMDAVSPPGAAAPGAAASGRAH